MDSLGSILSRKDYDEPPEMAAIKKYVKDEFDASVAVQVRDKDIVITARSASLANVLRLRGPAIKKAAKTDKRLTFRIG